MFDPVSVLHPKPLPSLSSYVLSEPDRLRMGSDSSWGISD